MELGPPWRQDDAAPSIRLGSLLITHNCRRSLDAADINPLHYLMTHCSGDALIPAIDGAAHLRMSRFDLEGGDQLFIVSDAALEQTTLMLGGDWSALGAALARAANLRG